MKQYFSSKYEAQGFILSTAKLHAVTYTSNLPSTAEVEPGGSEIQDHPPGPEIVETLSWGWGESTVRQGYGPESGKRL